MMAAGYSPISNDRRSGGWHRLLGAFLAVFCAFSFVLAGIAAAKTNKRAVAVIIGNKDYEDRIPDVEFAANDANAFRKFVVDVLGYDPENIIDLRNATKAQLEAAFGNRVTHEGKLWRYLDPKGRSDVVVFYSGHGVPGLKDKRGYLLPVDADPNSPEINGYPVDTLFDNLSKLEARSMSVFLDACFSGESHEGMLVRATSGITISPKLPTKTPTKMSIITAAQGDQVASWDFKAKHGMFTRHLLDALYGQADKGEYGNGDGKVALSEVKEYLDDFMTRAARREYGRHQNAWVNGDDGIVLTTPPKGAVRPTKVVARVVAPKPKPKPKPRVVAPKPVKPKPAPKKVVSVAPAPKPKPKPKPRLVRPPVGSSLSYSNRAIRIQRYENNIVTISTPTGTEKLLLGMIRMGKDVFQVHHTLSISSGEWRKASRLFPLQVGKRVKFELEDIYTSGDRHEDPMAISMKVESRRTVSFSGASIDVWRITAVANLDTPRRSNVAEVKWVIDYSPVLGLPLSVRESVNNWANWAIKTFGSYGLNNLPRSAFASR